MTAGTNVLTVVVGVRAHVRENNRAVVHPRVVVFHFLAGLRLSTRTLCPEGRQRNRAPSRSAGSSWGVKGKTRGKFASALIGSTGIAPAQIPTVLVAFQSLRGVVDLGFIVSFLVHKWRVQRGSVSQVQAPLKCIPA